MKAKHAMAERFPRSPGSGRPSRLIRWRMLAISIMVAGALGFALTLFLFNEDLFCLSSSTLLTLAGLGLLITARRRGWEPPERDQPQGSVLGRSAWPRPILGNPVPRGLRAASMARRPSQSPLLVDDAGTGRSAVQEEPVGPVEVLLAEQVQTILAGQGARITVLSRSADRSILRITTPSGQEHIALVMEGLAPAEAVEGRALLALLSQGSGRQAGLGYLIAAGGFSSSAYRWAADRGQIRLVGADELEELSM